MFLFDYYGVDWLAVVFTFLAIWQIGNKKKRGFILMMGANVCWAVMGGLTESIPMIVANILFFSMNTRALVKWSKS